MQRVEVVRGVYYDSVSLMRVAQELTKIDGVIDATLNMATEANIKIMSAAGFDLSGLDLRPSDLVIAVKAKEEIIDEIITKAKEYLSNPPWKTTEISQQYFPKSLNGALSMLPEANLALISIAGQHAGDEAMECLNKGLHVMLYSDNVSLEKEIELKNTANEKGLLVMGPDCGTAVIKGIGLGFANACPVGPVGMVAAAGTGLQEVHVQLAHRGIGVLHAIGTGGRDVKEAVGGITSLMGIEALLESDDVKVIVMVGKPPAPEVEKKIFQRLASGNKPAVLGYIGGELEGDRPPIYFCKELEETAAVAAAVVNGTDPALARKDLSLKYEHLKELASHFGKRKGYLRGLYSGGTLCYEAQLIASKLLGPIYSNAPLDGRYKLSDSLKSIGNCMVDYGEDEFTQGRLHPMMDSTFRAKRMIEEAKDDEVGVILFDCVLGYGCHESPADQLASAISQVKREVGDRVIFVGYVCGVEADPQIASRQRKILEDVGVVLADSNAQAARLACLLLQ